MAPTIIVGDDESAGDVAARLLELADNQRQVRVRTDLPRPAFEVPDALYRKYGGRGKRSDAERRVNAVDKMVADDDATTTVTSDDDLPDGAGNVDPDDVDDVGGPITSDDELPEVARNIDPPANGEYPDSGDQGAATDGSPAEQRNSDDDARTGGNPDPGASSDQGDQGDKPVKAARKRAPRKAAAAKPAADAGDGK